MGVNPFEGEAGHLEWFSKLYPVNSERNFALVSRELCTRWRDFTKPTK